MHGRQTTHHVVLDIEREFWQADPAFHDAHYADGILTIVGGQSSDRKEVLGEIADVPALASLDMRDVRIREVTDTVVAVTYHATATREGQPDPYDAMVSSVYVHRDGRWQLAVHQHSPRQQDG